MHGESPCLLSSSPTEPEWAIAEEKLKRYSDDIMIIVPGADKRAATRWIGIASRYTARYGANLEIARHKSTVHTLKKRKSGQLCTHVLGSHGRNGVEYLGFRYDGQRRFIRDSTLANLQRKITRTTRALARKHVRRYADKSADELVTSFPYHEVISRFGPIERFKDFKRDKTRWSFWTYVDRAIRVNGERGSHVRGQLRRLKPQIRRRLAKEIVRAKDRLS